MYAFIHHPNFRGLKQETGVLYVDLLTKPFRSKNGPILIFRNKQ